MQSSSKGLAARANRGMRIPHPVHQLAFRSSSRRLIKAYAGGVRIVFHMPFKCEMGDHVAVVGAGDLLGHWAIEKRLPLNWTEGDEWVGELDVPAGTTLEYKYIVVRADGSIEWSPGNNYVLEVPHSRGACMSVYEGWVKEGPRHVNITEMDGHRASSSSGPAPGQAGQHLQPDTAQDRESLNAFVQLVNSMVLKLNSATERLMRMEAEAAVCGLLTQYPSITVSKLHRAMMTLKLKNPDLTQDQLQSLLDSMERQHKISHTEGKYKINPGPANKALKTTMPATPGATPVPRREAEDASKGSSAGRPGAPKPARRMSPSSPAAFGRGPDVVGTSTPTPVLVPAIMKLLEVYSGMTLERLHRVLCGAVPNFTATMHQLESVLVSLKTEGRVILQDGLYKKGMATPSPNRRSSTPTAGRRPSSASGSPSPPPPPTRSRNDRAAYVAAAAASPASSPVTEEQLLSYESRVLSLLSNYSGCTCERLLGQLKATSDFPGNKQDLDTLLNRLASEGRVRDESGIYRYVSKRSLTPMGARGVSPTATHPTRTNGNPPAPARAPAPAPAPARNGSANGSKKGAPVTAFELYCADYREPVKARHPRAGQAEVNELLAREWAGAHSITRNRYEALEKSENTRLGNENGSNGSGAGCEQDGGEDEYSRSIAGSKNASRVSNRWWN